MAELIAFGKNKQHRLWQALPEGECVLLGRAPRNGFSVPWDPLISREHAHIRLAGGKLCVSELATARNPIFYSGKAVKEFSVDPQGEFLIGETTFRFEVRENAATTGPKIVEHMLSSTANASSGFDNANACLDALCKMPALMAQARSEADFAARVVELLLSSLRGALVAAVMQFDAEADGSDDATTEPKLIRWHSRGDAVRRFRPSRRLMSRAFDQQQSVVHVWCDGADPQANYTMTNDLDWAFCTPIPTAANEKWCLYVSGRRQFCGVRDVQSPDDLLRELRLAELMAKFMGAVRHVRVLEHQHTEMRQFFSPAVIETLVKEHGASALEPRQGPVSVLFCDVRGFSRKVEESSGNLHALLGQVGEALSVMSRSILKYEGVIADFQGDAALGFWGWPNPSDDAALLACRAALAIHDAFAAAANDSTHPLHGYQVGIGICHGEAIAGRIGSQEQIKVGVFGPVVNLASRLQDLTKQIGVPILVDATTAEAIAGGLQTDEAGCRRVTRLRPCGIATPVDVYALVPRGGGDLTENEAQAFELAVQSFVAGDWQKAKAYLAALPADDGPANFLRATIGDLGGLAPADWDGAVTMARRDTAVVFAV
jgi:adenylate cyclase